MACATRSGSSSSCARSLVGRDPRLRISMDILEDQHGAEALLGPGWKSAPLAERGCIPIRAEHPVPERDIPEVEAVQIVLMMDGVELGGLDHVAQPARRLQVRVIEVLARCGEEVVPEGAEHRTTEDRVQQNRRDHRVRKDLDRVLVERRQDLDA